MGISTKESAVADSARRQELTGSTAGSHKLYFAANGRLCIAHHTQCAWLHLDGRKDSPGTIVSQPADILRAVMSRNKAMGGKIKKKKEKTRRAVPRGDRVRSSEKRRRTVTWEET